jgi:competence protein ComEC
LGQKEYLDKDVLRSYSSAGAMHVLAVSGLHVGIVMLILAFFLAPLKKIQKGKIIYLICLLTGIWFYALITGLSPSVLRASVMFSFIIFGKELQRETSIYQSIMVSAFLLILIEPYIIFQVGFQLSYLAVLGIVYLQPKIGNLIYIKNFILYKAWQITAVSIAAQIATFPLGLYYFHQFPNFFMLSNLIVIPAAFLLLILGVSYFVLHLIPLLSDVILFLFDKMLTVLNWGVEFVQALPYSIVWGISIAWFEVILIYVALVLISLGLANKKVNYVFASLVLTLFLVGYNIYEKVRISNQHYACIYNVKDELAIDVFNGPENTFYSTKEFIANDEKLLFHVKHNWFYRSGREEPYNWKDISGTDLIALGDYSLLSLNAENHDSLLTHYPITDIVLISEINFISSEVIEIIKFYPSKVIIGPGVNYKVQNYLKSQIDSSKLHYLKTDGAFEIDLNGKI